MLIKLPKGILVLFLLNKNKGKLFVALNLHRYSNANNFPLLKLHKPMRNNQNATIYLVIG